MNMTWLDALGVIACALGIGVATYAAYCAYRDTRR